MIKRVILIGSLFTASALMGCNNTENDQPIESDQPNDITPSNQSGQNSANSTFLNLDKAKAVDGSLVGNVLKQGDIVVADGKTVSTNDFSFPDMINRKANGEDWVLVIKDEPVPNQSSRREIKSGKGTVAKMGDTVTIRYDMFSWSTGELIDTTQRLDNKSLNVTIGDLSAGSPVPTELNNALLNRAEGTQLEVVFPRLMSDLSPAYNRFDAYVLIVNIDSVLKNTNSNAVSAI